jgi:hypothetical protein
MPVLEVSIKADDQSVTSSLLVISMIGWSRPEACRTSATGQNFLISQVEYRLNQGVVFFFK